MATDYWDYNKWSGTSSSASSTTYYDTSGHTTGSSVSFPSATGSTGFVRWIQKKYLVKAPKRWNKNQVLGFVELVNYKTKTGWFVTMVIEGGDILITDPDVEKRSMNDFIPLLKRDAGKADMELINEFFEKNPIK